MTEDLVNIHVAESEAVDVVENYNGTANAAGLKPWRWQPGNAQNPGGRPKKKLISQAYRKVLQEADPNDPEARTFAEIIARGMVRAAANGDVAAAREIREVTEGKVPNKIELSATVDVNHILSDATEEECDAIIEKYLERRFGRNGFMPEKTIDASL